MELAGDRGIASARRGSKAAMRSTWIWAALLVACQRGPGPAPSPPANAPVAEPAAPVAPRSAFAASFATLPRSIVAAEPGAIGLLTEELLRTPDPVFGAACWTQLAAKVDGYFDVDLAERPERGVLLPAVLHGDLELDALRRCRVPADRRREASHPAVLVAADAGFFPVVFVDLGHDWMLVLRGELAQILPAAEAIAAEPPTQAHPLARVVGPSAAPGWRALGLDVTSELLGVPSVGVRAEFTPRPGVEPPEGTVTLTVRFDSGDAARRALAATTTPRPDLLGDVVTESLRLARQLGAVAVEGDAVTYRGQVTPALLDFQNVYLAHARHAGAPR